MLFDFNEERYEIRVSSLELGMLENGLGMYAAELRRRYHAAKEKGDSDKARAILGVYEKLEHLAEKLAHSTRNC